MTQADSWEGVLRRIDEKATVLKELVSGADEIVFTGCGSAFNISHAVAPFFQAVTGKSCKAVHASDLMIHRDSCLNRSKNSLVIAYSRSGDTTESAEALNVSKSAGARTLAVVCFERSRMAGDADEALILEEAVEKSVTTTRSLTSMVLAGNFLSAICSENSSMQDEFRNLPEIVRNRMSYFHETGKMVGENGVIKKYAFLGHGSYYGLAREAQLKIKEMVLLPSDSYVSLDYQHGPMSNVDKHMLVSILAADRGIEHDLSLAKKMNALGGKVLVICDRDSLGFAKHADYLIELGTDMGDGIRNVLYMPVLQFMAYYRSILEGQDPDNPKNLSYYIDLKKN
jgi:glucosamine--fructose-6-phosphate aminotransferase (isomerizing)